MKKFVVTEGYSVWYQTVIEADTQEEAEQKWENGDYNESTTTEVERSYEDHYWDEYYG